MNRRRASVIAVLLAFGILGTILNWFGNWYESHDQRTIATQDG